MSLFKATERSFLDVLSRMVHCNPFLAERFELERLALGEDYLDLVVPTGKLGKFDELQEPNPNHERLDKRVEELAEGCRQRLADGVSPGDSEEVRLYEDLVLYLLYRRYRFQLDATIKDYNRQPKERPTVGYWHPFAAEVKHFLAFSRRPSPAGSDPAHLLALFIQVRRAMHNIFDCILGTSQPIMNLRGEVWQSIFTDDMRSYRHGVYEKMSDFTTLITGASGTGKELVARAIGLSRYVPFHVRSKKLEASVVDTSYPLNLTALPDTLIESALFGHRKGLFTGATDVVGWLQKCPRTGAVFLDEIGQLQKNAQVKLLRVLENRTFYRLGELRERDFRGKIIAATNHDLEAEVREGRFRSDFYYRLCSDRIHTPSLREQLDDQPGDLRKLTYLVAYRLDRGRAESLADQVDEWVKKEIGSDYAWPGNMRELTQCVRNIVIRNKFVPISVPQGGGTRHAEASRDRHSIGPGKRLELGAREVLSWYCTLVYSVTGSYEAAARWLKMDPRTVKKNVDPGRLEGRGDWMLP